MSTLRDELRALLARFDEESYVALANRGLVRRARKDLEQQSVEIVEERPHAVVVAFGPHRIQLDGRGPAHARCDCPATGTCQHILAVAMGLQQQWAVPAAEAAAETASAVMTDPTAPLREALLAMTSAELIRHAGKAGYRWAWQYLQDLEAGHAVQFGATRHLLLSLQRPRATLRYMGGGVDALIADVELPQIEKYRVAAVLAFQRAHGLEPAPPEPATRPRNAELNLGQDHAPAGSRELPLEASRARLRLALRRLLTDSVGLGLAHLSQGVHERYATLAVWAQGAEYHRLARLTRRIADHVEMLLGRVGGADEQQLLDEMTLAYGLTCALEAAAARGAAPPPLVGRARARYEATATLELIGLGALAWRSAAGYRGLTMIFWAPSEQAFMSCTDARPESLGGFNPVARYTAAGPWAGLSSPKAATGSRLMLLGAQASETGRLSAADRCSATLTPLDAAALLRQLRLWTDWAALEARQGEGRGSLLAEPDPLKDWVALQPAQFGPARFDPVRQTLAWPLQDGQGQTLNAEIAFDDHGRHAIDRIEALRIADLPPGTVLIARLRGSGPGGWVAEPLSLIRPGRHMPAVDALHFDAPPDAGPAAALLKRITRKAVPTPASPPAGPRPLPTELRELRHELQRQAERGMVQDSAPRIRTELARHGDRLAQGGWTAFPAALAANIDAAELILRLNYLCLQCERLIAPADGATP